MEKQYTPKKAKAAQLTNDSVDSKKNQAETKNLQSPAIQNSKQEKVDSVDVKTELKEEAKEVKPAKKEAIKVKKEEAIAHGLHLHASKKHCMYICSYIKDKSIDKALLDLQEVIKMKKPIPFKGEIPHRSYPGMMSGRYPVKASKQFIYILKALRGNAITNGLELEKTKIVLASANWASRPQKRGGARFKRTHVLLKAKEIAKVEKQVGENR
ncbi:MAG: hypothetical protein Q8Q31_01975 [Nanoarchaeota archaeon]|nr:hypothetical protein [Nanoarchaeota archaeon]